MAITRAQQAKQMLREGGRLGYRFGGEYQGGTYDSPAQSFTDSVPASSYDSPAQSFTDSVPSSSYDAPTGAVDDPFKGAGQSPDYFTTTNLTGYDEETGVTTPPQTTIIDRDGDGVVTVNDLDTLYRTGVPKSNFPGVIGLGLNLLKPVRDRSLKVNIDYFRSLENIDRSMYPETADGYRQYMKDRLAGKIDAAGNTIISTDNNNNNNFIPVDTRFTQTPSDVDQETDTTEEDEGLRLAFRANGGRIGAMDGGMMNPVGGIMDLETGRQMYFLGKLVKKATRAVKKIAKSPIGKAALIGGGLGLAGIGPFKGLAKFGLAAKNFAANKIFGPAMDYGRGTGGILDFIKENPMTSIFGASAVAGLLTPEQEDEAQQLADNTGIDIEAARNSILQAAKENYAMDVRARGFKADGGLMRLGFDEGGKDLSTDANYKGWKKLYEKNPDAAAMNDNHQQYLNFYERNKTKQAEGSKEPVAKKTMPLLDMGGMEKDYREDGGFVPIGRMERADDVPARLSKNEFVFTADAVRNAGEGDIDKGAEVMYNMMKNLEAGGEVSEESQGLEGARRMFQTSQRLEEVL